MYSYILCKTNSEAFLLKCSVYSVHFFFTLMFNIVHFLVAPLLSLLVGKFLSGWLTVLKNVAIERWCLHVPLPSGNNCEWELLCQQSAQYWPSLGVLILFKASEKEPLLMVRIKMINRYTDEVKGSYVQWKNSEILLVKLKAFICIYSFIHLLVLNGVYNVYKQSFKL